MKLFNISRKTRGRIVLGLAVIIPSLLLWNHFKENKTYQWNEVLETSDGKTLRIQRKVEFVGGGGDISVSSGRRVDNQVVVFKSINGNSINIVWQSIRRGYADLYPEVPLVVDYDTKENIPIVISINGLTRKRNCYEYFKHKYTNKKWTSEKVTIVDVGRESNIFRGLPQGFRLRAINDQDRLERLRNVRTVPSNKKVMTDQVYCRYGQGK